MVGPPPPAIEAPFAVRDLPKDYFVRRFPDTHPMRLKTWDPSAFGAEHRLMLDQLVRPDMDFVFDVGPSPSLFASCCARVQLVLVHAVKLSARWRFHVCVYAWLVYVLVSVCTCV